jgi:hypothetical protein
VHAVVAHGVNWGKIKKYENRTFGETLHSWYGLPTVFIYTLAYVNMCTLAVCVILFNSVMRAMNERAWSHVNRLFLACSSSSAGFWRKRLGDRERNTRSARGDTVVGNRERSKDQ